jgi:hypothetical protein
MYPQADEQNSQSKVSVKPVRATLAINAGQ